MDCIQYNTCNKQVKRNRTTPSGAHATVHKSRIKVAGAGVQVQVMQVKVD